MSELLTWFGDDFTGSGDVLLQYTRAGVPALLFLGTPGVDELRGAAERHDAIGIAGITRALPTGQIGPIVRTAFERLAALRPRVVQYKICSTADSSRETGSIAPAVQIGRELFGARPVGILPAQPDLGRYTLFANHFGRDATGVHRLDRLPAMAGHPVTPMGEADLRVHFAEQLGTDVAGLPITALRAGDAPRLLAELADGDATAVVLDALDNDDLASAAGALLHASPEMLFAVGSGGLSTGLAARRVTRSADRTAERADPGHALVVSGSAAARTSEQIDAAVEAGWAAVPLDPRHLGPDAVAKAVADAAAALDDCPGAVVFTAHRERLPPAGTVASRDVGAALGDVVREVRRRTGVARVLVAGGDTSGYVLTRLGARTLSAVGTVGRDLVLGVVGSGDPDVDGVEVALKGGQLGGVDVFEEARLATAWVVT